MSDEIYLEPAKAGQTLLQMQNTLKKFNDQIHEIGVQLKSTANITYSEPLTKALGQAAHNLNNIGQGVNSGVYAFSHAFVNVVEEWKKTDAKSAASVSFKKPHFEPIHLVYHKARKLHVHPIDMIKGIDTIEDGGTVLKNQFEEMDNLLRDSVHYWRGESASHTRESWRRHIEPLKESTAKTIQTVANMMRDELQAFINRDSQNFPGKW